MSRAARPRLARPLARLGAAIAGVAMVAGLALPSATLGATATVPNGLTTWYLGMPGPGGTVTAAGLAQDLAGTGVTVSNVTFTGAAKHRPAKQIVDAHHVRLRAERSGTGNGRVYTITITCKDSAQNSSTKATTVVVPLSQK